MHQFRICSKHVKPNNVFSKSFNSVMCGNCLLLGSVGVGLIPSVCRLHLVLQSACRQIFCNFSPPLKDKITSFKMHDTHPRRQLISPGQYGPLLIFHCMFGKSNSTFFRLPIFFIYHVEEEGQQNPARTEPPKAHIPHQKQHSSVLEILYKMCQILWLSDFYRWLCSFLLASPFISFHTSFFD